MIVREALPREMESVGALRVRAHQAQGLLAASPPYARVLRSRRRCPGVTLLAFGIPLGAPGES